MSVEVQTLHRTTVQCPVPADMAQSETFAKSLLAAAQDGYAVKAASTLEGGDQRDPYTVGVCVVLEK